MTAEPGAGRVQAELAIRSKLIGQIGMNLRDTAPPSDNKGRVTSELVTELRRTIDQRGIAVSALASRVGVSSSHLEACLAGARNLAPARLVAICRELGIEFGFFRERWTGSRAIRPFFAPLAPQSRTSAPTAEPASRRTRLMFDWSLSDLQASISAEPVASELDGLVRRRPRRLRLPMTASCCYPSLHM